MLGCSCRRMSALYTPPAAHANTHQAVALTARKSPARSQSFVLDHPRSKDEEGRALLEQLRVRAALFDNAVLDDADLGRALHRGEPVRDDEHRAVVRHAVQRLLHQRLALRIQRARGLRPGRQGSPHSLLTLHFHDKVISRGPQMSSLPPIQSPPYPQSSKMPLKNGL